MTDTLEPGTRSSVVVATLAAAGIVVSLAQTLVVPIIGSLPQIFQTDASNTAWVITVTLLAGAVSTPVVGRLADMYGKKRMLLIAIIPFIVGSVLCALSADIVTMIVGRGMQGLATGMIPLGISLLHDVLPKDKAGGAIALMSSSMGIGGALGLPIAAAVAEFADWRVLFWGTAGAAALVALAIWRAIPVREPKGQAHGFDYVGAFGLASGLIALMLAISKGAEWGWGSALTIGCFVTAAVVLGLWGWYELRRRAPLVDLRTTTKPVILLTNIASILVGFAMYAMNLIVPQVMQLPVEIGYGLGQSMFQMGLWAAPMGIGMMAVSNLGARISRVRGAKVTLTLAGIVIAVGYGVTAVVLATIGSRAPGPADDAVVLWTLILLTVGTTVVGCGVGFAFGAMPALIMSAAPANEKAAANGFNSLMRSLGTTASAAIVGAVLGSMVHRVGEYIFPTQGAFILSLVIGCIAALVASVIASTIPGNVKR
ncbi:MFS transporter [Microbacterium sp. BWT-G7]|uniref:MFS transporter n=1 Tax=Microbacterium allomyrinae TaxID=2830666 RepID=A0A9X1LUS6_9MICO|nr:MFS transporter [Microbacterium allomyrinae]